MNIKEVKAFIGKITDKDVIVEIEEFLSERKEELEKPLVVKIGSKINIKVGGHPRQVTVKNITEDGYEVAFPGGTKLLVGKSHIISVKEE